jgi:site-specific DNA-methyltransferase (adenine-specific)
MSAHRKEVLAEGCEIWLGDCRDVLPLIGRVDAVVTDPPFNAGKTFANDKMDSVSWMAFCADLARCVSAITPTNVLIEVGKNDAAMRAAFDAVLPYRWALALNYTNAMRQGAVGYSNFGLVLWYGRKCFSRFMDRIDCSLHSTIDEFEHPSPKEIGHYQALTKMFSPDAGTVCDPFMGSGTTGVACVNLGRRFIGIELEPKYYDISRRRLSEALSRPRLPFEEPINPKQEALPL